MKTYEIDLKSGEEFIKRYIDNGGEVYIADEGVLGLGTIILYDYDHKHNLKEYIIQEYYLNEWSSGHKLKEYKNGLPKKYIKVLEENI